MYRLWGAQRSPSPNFKQGTKIPYAQQCGPQTPLFLIMQVEWKRNRLLLFSTIYRELPWRRQWHPTPALLPGKSHGQRSLVGCGPRGREESDTTERLHFHALEKEMATHSSVLAWSIPGMAEPGGLPSMGSHRVGHD